MSFEESAGWFQSLGAQYAATHSWTDTCAELNKISKPYRRYGCQPEYINLTNLGEGASFTAALRAVEPCHPRRNGYVGFTYLEYVDGADVYVISEWSEELPEAPDLLLITKGVASVSRLIGELNEITPGRYRCGKSLRQICSDTWRDEAPLCHYDPLLAVARDDADSFVYFLKAGRHVKVGKATSIDRRIRELQTGCPVKIVQIGAIRGGYQTESAIHEFWKKKRGEGEWFSSVSKGDVSNMIARINFYRRYTPQLTAV